MATHSSILAWRIPWTKEPGRPQSMGSQRVRHNWATSTHDTKSMYTKGDLPSLDPRPCSEPLPTHASTGGLPTLAGGFGSVSCGVTAPFFWVLVHARFCCALQDWSFCFPQSCESFVIKSHWASRSDSLGIPSPFVPGCEACRGVQNLHNSGRTPLELCSPVCGSPTWWVWDLILLWLCPFYHLAEASSLSSDMGFFLFCFVFLVGSSILLLMGVQQLDVILVLWQEKMSTCPSAVPSWTRSPKQS